ncbi:somatomedin-B and thrombospondin type-1 domain-containing protein isoform X1 [Sceloporus undulatus]|uniref:somatomedin-B and thrombospondin type-1 domain-containing protein isoform X1 n=1 Tax=Sceloporus undulatus TaxID=8520 RepID=UPI001C4C2E30|nr:somatomedin-B and thrombospondin type-1 domain-containing protein isoform X1 [Sceloporus undulatus]
MAHRRWAGEMGSLAFGVLQALLLLLLALARCARAGCAAEGRCCPGKEPSCASTGWRLSRAYGTCYCDEECQRTGDCCYDYAQVCPAVPCIVGEWSHWSGCAEQCQPKFRMRRRSVQQEPKNGGEPCPPLEEKAGCLEYTTYEGQECANEHVPAFITSFEYNKERKKRAVNPRWSSETEESRSYCVEFKTESLSPYCSMETRPYARWMQYLREGYTVCVTCQPPAMHTVSHRCYGDGVDADRNKVLHWQAVGNPSCRGTWKKVQQVEECSCPLVHSFIFT